MLIRKVVSEHRELYFYREYGGKEVDLIIEDYKKNYITVEIKSKKGNVPKSLVSAKLRRGIWLQVNIRNLMELQ